MENNKIIIAVDGHSSTGKSSFAKIIASKLGYIYVDTGALYRAATYFAYNNGFIDNRCRIDKDGLKKTLCKNSITFKPGKDGKSETYLNDVNIEKYIRTIEISNKVSHISTLPFVRNFVDNLLHKFGEEKGVVMDGRDIGTAVFPNAELKIFMTASPEIRAQRRFKEIQEAGGKETYNEVLKNLKERDYIDEHRSTAPLVKANDAILLDNSTMTIPEQFIWLNKILLDKFELQIM
ncbi:MAG: (d)CMP kinase [Bacteroidales bacterium]